MLVQSLSLLPSFPLRVRSKIKPGGKIVEGRPSRMWHGVKASVSVGSEETVVSEGRQSFVA